MKYETDALPIEPTRHLVESVKQKHHQQYMQCDVICVQQRLLSLLCYTDRREYSSTLTVSVG
jgi:hypothetical protein